jgi:hypothetical protein
VLPYQQKIHRGHKVGVKSPLIEYMGVYKERAEPVAQQATSSLKERWAGFALEKRERR